MNLPGSCWKLQALRMPAGRHTLAATPPKPTRCLHPFAAPNPCPLGPASPPPTRDARGQPGAPRSSGRSLPTHAWIHPRRNSVPTRAVPSGRASGSLPTSGEAGDLRSHHSPHSRAPRRFHCPRRSRLLLHRAGMENLGAGPGWTELVPRVPSGCDRDRTGWRKEGERRGHSRWMASGPDSDSRPRRTRPRSQPSLQQLRGWPSERPGAARLYTPHSGSQSEACPPGRPDLRAN